jgi:hypothetical protein
MYPALWGLVTAGTVRSGRELESSPASNHRHRNHASQQSREDELKGAWDSLCRWRCRSTGARCTSLSCHRLLMRVRTAATKTMSQRDARNSSLDMLQSLSILFNSPTRISFTGTVTKVPFRCNVTSLLFCLTLTKPNLLHRILISSLPSTGRRRVNAWPRWISGLRSLQAPFSPSPVERTGADREHLGNSVSLPSESCRPSRRRELNTPRRRTHHPLV